MAPDLKQVEQQTFTVLSCLFNDDDIAVRHQAFGCIETDGPEDDDGDDDRFDPVLIADKLKEVADALNEDVKFKAALNELKHAVAQEALDQALSSGIDTLVKSQVGQRAEVAPELQIIRASVAFGLYMKKTYPHVKNQLHSAIGAFLNQRVGSWVTQQGGWERVASVSQP